MFGLLLTIFIKWEAFMVKKKSFPLYYSLVKSAIEVAK